MVRSSRVPSRLAPARTEPYSSYSLNALVSLTVRRFDVLHAFHIPSARAAAAVAAARRAPLVLSVMGIPDQAAMDAYRGRLSTLRAAWRRASAVHVLSEAARRAADRVVAPGAAVIHPGTFTRAFALDQPKARNPLIYCPAAANDPRKRVRLLAEAFGMLRGRRPTARLSVSHGGEVPSWLDVPGVEIVSPSTSGDRFASLYGRAHVTVLPSEREAFGQVLVESMAAGTPVVAFDDGAGPEVVRDGDTGVLCTSPEATELAGALARALDLAAKPATAEACRSHASRWDWSVVGPRFERLYAKVLGISR